MVAINSSAASTTALRALQATSKAMEQSQTRISTGYKVNSSSDNATLWKLAQSVRSDISSTSSIKDGLTTALGQTKAASSALDTISDILGDMQSVLTEANGATDTKKQSLQVQLASLQQQLKTTVAAASFGGVNLLDGSTSTLNVATGYTKDTGLTTDSTALTAIYKDSTHGVLATAGATSTKTALSMTLAVYTSSWAYTSNSDITTLQSELATVVDNISTASATMSATTQRLQSQSDFLTQLNDIKKTALGDLIDADVDEESAKLSALQVQQQLATTALSIINQSKANILQLFQ